MKRFATLRQGAARMVLGLALLFGAAVTLSACNTTAGAGQDLSAGGHAVTNTAEKAKSAM